MQRESAHIFSSLTGLSVAAFVFFGAGGAAAGSPSTCLRFFGATGFVVVVVVTTVTAVGTGATGGGAFFGAFAFAAFVGRLTFVPGGSLLRIAARSRASTPDIPSLLVRKLCATMRVLVTGSDAIRATRGDVTEALDALRLAAHTRWSRVLTCGATNLDSDVHRWARTRRLTALSFAITGEISMYRDYGQIISRVVRAATDRLVRQCDFAVVFWDGADADVELTLERLCAAGKETAVIVM